MVNTIGSHTVGEKGSSRKITVDTDVGVDVNVDTGI